MNGDDSSDSVIEVRDIHKSYGKGAAKTRVLHGITLDVLRGELLMIEGPSGCGKTTLLSILSGTLKPDSGKVAVLGEPIEMSHPDKLARFRSRHLGFAFQQFNLIPTISVWENVTVPLLIQGKSSGKARQSALSILERVGLGELSNHLPNRLSVGQQQRVAIARALVHEPEIIVCDEPTSALDGPTGEQVMSMLSDLTREDNATVVLVTHDPRIHHFASRMIRMEDGRIQNEG